VFGNKIILSMKRIIPYLATTLLSLTVGYFAGGFRGTHQAAIGSNAGSLVWLTAIHEMISRGNYDRAKEVTEGAVDAHVAMLSRVQRDPASVFVWLIPWAPDVVGQVTPTALRRAKEYFVEKTTVLKPETRDFLATTQTKQ
jgi:hypothetical protein